MPTYEYRCEDCGHQFTVIEPIREHGQHPTRCPKCQSDKVEQAVSSFFLKTSKKS